MSLRAEGAGRTILYPQGSDERGKVNAGDCRMRGAKPCRCANAVKNRGKVVDLTGAESNRLFEVLQDWNSQLAHFDLDDLWCDNDNFAP
jgi:hypothetical protein